MSVPAELTAAEPSIPTAGLVEVTRAWSGAGQLFEALAAVDEPERKWSARDVERRARRIFFQRLVPLFVDWPRQEDQWLEALPAESLRPREVAAAPTSGTDWVEVRRRGWPPREFPGRRRIRIADTLLVTCLRWTLDALEPIVDDARAVHASVDALVQDRVEAALALLEDEPVALAMPVPPTPADITAVASEGYPWNALAPVTSQLRALDDASVIELASLLVVPDDPLTGRLFHLGVLGELLLALRARKASIKPIRPLSGAASTGPSYRITDVVGIVWDLWFEAAAIWSAVGQPSPYSIATSGVPGSGSAVGGDLMLIDEPRTRAMIIECKYSSDSSRVARDGYHQAVTYATEARELVDAVTSVVIGPVDIVATSKFTSVLPGLVGVWRPDEMDELLHEAGFPA